MLETIVATVCICEILLIKYSTDSLNDNSHSDIGYLDVNLLHFDIGKVLNVLIVLLWYPPFLFWNFREKFWIFYCRLIQSYCVVELAVHHELLCLLVFTHGSFYQLTFLVLKLEYFGQHEAITWLLMPRRHEEPGHQHPWYWLCKIGGSLFTMGKDFNYLLHPCCGKG